MKRSRHTAEQIIRKLKTAEQLIAQGKTVAEICRVLEVTHKKTVLPDGRIQVTALVEDEGEIGLGASAGVGVVSGKAGKSWTEGEGRTVVFILEPKNTPWLSLPTL